MDFLSISNINSVEHIKTKLRSRTPKSLSSCKEKHDPFMTESSVDTGEKFALIPHTIDLKEDMTRKSDMPRESDVQCNDYLNEVNTKFHTSQFQTGKEDGDKTVFIKKTPKIKRIARRKISQHDARSLKSSKHVPVTTKSQNNEVGNSIESTTSSRTRHFSDGNRMLTYTRVHKKRYSAIRRSVVRSKAIVSIPNESSNESGALKSHDSIFLGKETSVDVECNLNAQLAQEHIFLSENPVKSNTFSKEESKVNVSETVGLLDNRPDKSETAMLRHHSRSDTFIFTDTEEETSNDHCEQESPNAQVTQQQVGLRIFSDAFSSGDIVANKLSDICVGKDIKARAYPQIITPSSEPLMKESTAKGSLKNEVLRQYIEGEKLKRAVRESFDDGEVSKKNSVTSMKEGCSDCEDKKLISSEKFSHICTNKNKSNNFEKTNRLSSSDNPSSYNNKNNQCARKHLLGDKKGVNGVENVNEKCGKTGSLTSKGVRRFRKNYLRSDTNQFLKFYPLFDAFDHGNAKFDKRHDCKIDRKAKEAIHNSDSNITSQRSFTKVRNVEEMFEKHKNNKPTKRSSSNKLKSRLTKTRDKLLINPSLQNLKDFPPQQLSIQQREQQQHNPKQPQLQHQNVITNYLDTTRNEKRNNENPVACRRTTIKRCVRSNNDKMSAVHTSNLPQSPQTNGSATYRLQPVASSSHVIKAPQQRCQQQKPHQQQRGRSTNRWGGVIGSFMSASNRHVLQQQKSSCVEGNLSFRSKGNSQIFRADNLKKVERCSSGELTAEKHDGSKKQERKPSSKSGNIERDLKKESPFHFNAFSGSTNKVTHSRPFLNQRSHSMFLKHSDNERSDENQNSCPAFQPVLHKVMKRAKSASTMAYKKIAKENIDMNSNKHHKKIQASQPCSPARVSKQSLHQTVDTNKDRPNHSKSTAPITNKKEKAKPSIKPNVITRRNSPKLHNAIINYPDAKLLENYAISINKEKTEGAHIEITPSQRKLSAKRKRRRKRRLGSERGLIDTCYIAQGIFSKTRSFELRRQYSLLVSGLKELEEEDSELSYPTYRPNPSYKSNANTTHLNANATSYPSKTSRSLLVSYINPRLKPNTVTKRKPNQSQDRLSSASKCLGPRPSPRRVSLSPRKPLYSERACARQALALASVRHGRLPSPATRRDDVGDDDDDDDDEDDEHDDDHKDVVRDRTVRKRTVLDSGDVTSLNNRGTGKVNNFKLDLDALKSPEIGEVIRVENSCPIYKASDNEDGTYEDCHMLQTKENKSSLQVPTTSVVPFASHVIPTPPPSPLDNLNPPQNHQIKDDISDIELNDIQVDKDDSGSLTLLCQATGSFEADNTGSDVTSGSEDGSVKRVPNDVTVDVASIAGDEFGGYSGYASPDVEFSDIDAPCQTDGDGIDRSDENFLCPYIEDERRGDALNLKFEKDKARVKACGSFHNTYVDLDNETEDFFVNKKHTAPISELNKICAKTKTWHCSSESLICCGLEDNGCFNKQHKSDPEHCLNIRGVTDTCCIKENLDTEIETVDINIEESNLNQSDGRPKDPTIIVNKKSSTNNEDTHYAVNKVKRHQLHEVLTDTKNHSESSTDKAQSEHFHAKKNNNDIIEQQAAIDYKDEQSIEVSPCLNKVSYIVKMLEKQNARLSDMDDFTDVKSGIPKNSYLRTDKNSIDRKLFDFGEKRMTDSNATNDTDQKDKTTTFVEHYKCTLGQEIAEESNFGTAKVEQVDHINNTTQRQFLKRTASVLGNNSHFYKVKEKDKDASMKHIASISKTSKKVGKLGKRSKSLATFRTSVKRTSHENPACSVHIMAHAAADVHIYLNHGKSARPAVTTVHVRPQPHATAAKGSKKPCLRSRGSSLGFRGHLVDAKGL